MVPLGNRRITRSNIAITILISVIAAPTLKGDHPAWFLLNIFHAFLWFIWTVFTTHLLPSRWDTASASKHQKKMNPQAIGLSLRYHFMIPTLHVQKSDDQGSARWPSPESSPPPIESSSGCFAPVPPVTVRASQLSEHVSKSNPGHVFVTGMWWRASHCYVHRRRQSGPAKGGRTWWFCRPPLWSRVMGNSRLEKEKKQNKRKNTAKGM